MRRQFDDIIAYDVHRKITQELGLSINNYIKAKMFTSHTSSSIIKNLFPYQLKDNLHYCLWINPKYERFWTKSRVRVEIFRFAEKKQKKLTNYFINPFYLQSISAIKHWHIFLK